MQKLKGVRSMEIIGHRGAAGTCPENTMVSFQRAIEEGASGIELDVHLSKDGEIIVIHDETVDRTTDGRGYIGELTYKDIRKLNAKYKFKEHNKCMVPSLPEVFEWAKEEAFFINIELKNNVIEYPLLEWKVVDLVHQYGLKDRIVFSSFNHNSLARVLSYDSRFETAVLYSHKLFEPWHYAKHLGSDGLHPNSRNVTEVVVKAAHKEGLKVRPYTVNKKEEMLEMKKAGCDAIVTDYPKKAIELLK